MTSSYDAIPDFGLLYDSVPLYATRPDVAFYVDEGKAASGPVLELGCGTGRILLPLARAGCTVTGLDNSRAMLERCRAKLAGEAAPVRGRVTLHEGDLRDFTLGTTFALVTAPFRGLQHLTTIPDQLAGLAAVAKHLAPGGRFVFDVFQPDFAALVGADGVEREDTPALRLADGRSMRRTARVVRVRRADQVSEVEVIYYVTPRGGAAPQRFVQAFEMRWFLRAELEHLLARAGFRVRDVWGDWARGPLGDVSRDITISAEVAR